MVHSRSNGAPEEALTAGWVLCIVGQGEEHKVVQLNSRRRHRLLPCRRRLGSYKGVSLFSLCKLYCRRAREASFSSFLSSSSSSSSSPIRLSLILTLLGDYLREQPHPHGATLAYNAPPRAGTGTGLGSKLRMKFKGTAPGKT